MASDPSHGRLDDWLELEQVAVGPYCVFDSFRPPLSPTTSGSTPRHSSESDREGMEEPSMKYEFPPYSGGVRPSWLTTANDDVPLPATSDDLAGSNWTDFMAWDPNTSQAPELKLSGPACFLRPEMQRPVFNRRQNSEHDIPTTVAMPNQQNNTPFTFGDNVDLPPAFDFDANPLSSPSSGESQQHNGFYPTPMWQQQQGGDNSMFSPRFDTSRIPAPVPALSSSSRSTPELVPQNPKKRKSSTDDADPVTTGKKEKGQPPKKTAHNMIEKRYRTNLNDKIAALRDSVPSLRVMSRGNGQGNEEDDDPEDLEGLTPAHKLNKATVLSKATEYIRHLEKRNKHLQDEVTALKGRVESYEKMSMSGPMSMHGSVGTPDANRYSEDPFTPSHGMSMSGPPQGMIPVPEHIAGLRQGLPPQAQAHYASAYPSYVGTSRPNHAGPPMVPGRRNTMVGKLMVGSLAGLMVLEGFAERQQSKEASEDRGLFALPLNLAAVLTPRVSLGASNVQLPLAKLLLIFGAIFYIFAPLFDSKPKQQKKKAAHSVKLAGNPSLALPVEMRHKAWLTSIQTVWVPRHNFLLEVAALGLKMVKLSTRKIIGWDRYASLTGTTKDHETARVKAWGIALDAQLTGGDAEISKSRLVLTLMASGTLPDTPGRLMLKALHIRVLLWELAHAGHSPSWVFDKLSAKLSRRYWNMARSEQRIATNLSSKPNSEAEPLPEHLATLLEKECDDVLVPCIVQRAYNLAWNRQIAEDTSVDPSMDGVVEDFAISSPLDALAAWYSSYRLKSGLASYLACKDGKAKESVKFDLTLAAQTAPPTSQAQLRSLVAQAVVLDDDSNARIAAASKALPTPPITSPGSKGITFTNLVSSAPVATDVRKALTLAKCHMLISSNNPSAHRHAVFVVNNTFLSEATTTLLSFVAGYKILNAFMENKGLQIEAGYGLEGLASSLRKWVGHEPGRRIGLGNKVRSKVIGRCLEASKVLVGLAEKSRDKEGDDPGYYSASVKGDEAET
ncbi:hypothetical protein P280DRAFT_444964 [Massarina eburnea CBS 473.64]|uniref:BHLH domain-containing protein n=1 Tax=Massarina eburnea CBS 473.64 TaxID=1395130 RepID=A0A6A6S8A2_9PLEO|nr:hypothetical protein P280DRAFT_444964 [Massarina eburnea CBS 473.64]